MSVRLFLSTPQILFIILASLVFASISGILIFLLSKKYRSKLNYKKSYHRKIYRIALDNDYYLINNVNLKIDNANTLMIDHLLFGDKFIFVILDYNYIGEISGKCSDRSFVFKNKFGKRYYIDNMLEIMNKLVSYLCSLTQIDKSYFVGVSIYPKDSKCYVETNYDNNFIVNIAEIKNIIRQIETRNIGKIKEEDLQRVVDVIAKANNRLINNEL